jgi:SulP family sulfate permease
VVIATALVYVFRLDQSGLKVVGIVPAGLPSPQLPSFDWGLTQQLLPTVFTLTLVAFMEAYSIGKALELKHKDHKLLPNQELRALGLANILGSIFQAFPTAGGFSRTAVNDQSGAKTGLAAIISASFVVLTLLVLTPLLRYLPQSILASVIMVAVVGLVDLKAPVRLWKADRIDFMLLLATFVVTLLFGIMPGIAAGVLLSLVMVVFRAAAPHIAVLGQLPGSPHFRNVERFPEALQRPDVLALRLDSQLFFANAVFFRDRLLREAHKKGAALKLVLIDAEAISFLDSTAIEMLRGLHADFKARGIAIFVSGAKGPVRDALHRSGLMTQLGSAAMYVHASEALEAWDNMQAGADLPADDRAVQVNLRRSEARVNRKQPS